MAFMRSPVRSRSGPPSFALDCRRRLPTVAARPRRWAHCEVPRATVGKPTEDARAPTARRMRLALGSDRAVEPAAEQLRRFVGRCAVKGHQRGGSAGTPGDLRPPPVTADRQHLDHVRSAVDDFLKTDDVHADCDCNDCAAPRKRNAVRSCTTIERRGGIARQERQ